MNHRPLVILGGMGPQASIRFQQLILQKSELYHHGDGNQYPYIVHYSLPVRDFISDDAAQDAAVASLEQLAEPISHLQPSCIALACNTAHLLVPRVTHLQSPSFLSMIDVVAGYIQQQGIQRVGLLATPATIRSKLYEKALERRHIQTIVPNKSQLLQLELVIRQVIAGQLDTASQKALLAIAGSLAEQGAEAILLGCTELPLAFQDPAPPIPVLDCLDLYATAAVKEYYLYNKGQL